jgi:hypothetical protein
MIVLDSEPVIKKRRLTDSSTGNNLSFCRSRPPSGRVAAVETLRRHHHGSKPDFGDLLA